MYVRMDMLCGCARARKRRRQACIHQKTATIHADVLAEAASRRRRSKRRRRKNKRSGRGEEQ
eukprot:5732451-Pyramimonas_sp.AAC.1